MNARLSALFTIAALATAGCVSLPDAPGAVSGLSTAPPTIDARAVIDGVKWLCDTYPKRNVDGPDHRATRDWIHRELESAGLETFRDPFKFVNRHSPASGTPTGGVGTIINYENIVGVKWGQDREKWIVVGGHYDTTDAAACGAYDNGSGTVLTVLMAKAFANLTLNRTVLFVLFDAEEQGAHGSRHMVNNLTTGTWHLQGEVVAMAALDMVGISHPHPSKLSAETTAPEMIESVKKWAAVAGVPEEKLHFGGGSPGGSDDASFEAAEIPAIQFSGDQDDPYLGPAPIPTGRTGYPFWHRYDTYETMVQAAGGEDVLEAGTKNAAIVAMGVTFDLAQGLTPTWVPPK